MAGLLRAVTADPPAFDPKRTSRPGSARANPGGRLGGLRVLPPASAACHEASGMNEGDGGGQPADSSGTCAKRWPTANSPQGSAPGRVLRSAAAMPRRLRLELPGTAMHIVQRGVKRAAVFIDDNDRFSKTRGQVEFLRK